MKKYTHLAKEERYHIYGLQKAGHKLAYIAAELGKHKSTISRELRRNRGQRGYRANQAHGMAQERRIQNKNAQRITETDWTIVDACLAEKLSPEQIAGRLKQSGRLNISHETIYQYVYRDKRAGGKLVEHLRGQKPYRKRYASGEQRRGTLKNRVSIDDRPVIVAEKSRIGDWEGDTVIGHQHQGAVVTLVDRYSRYALAAPVPSKHAEGVAAAVTKLLMPHKARCHTITFDNGREFAEHETIATQLAASVYFAHPYHSWERGLNENTNGLLRQYFPKQTNLREVSDEQVQYAINQMNHRPRKCLGYRTPHEVFFNEPSLWNSNILDVALRI